MLLMASELNADAPKLSSAASSVTVPAFTAVELSAMIYQSMPLNFTGVVVLTRLAYGFRVNVFVLDEKYTADRLSFKAGRTPSVVWTFFPVS